MHKTLILAGLATLSLSATAVADKPESTGKPADKPAKSQRPADAGKPAEKSGKRKDGGKKHTSKGRARKTHTHAFNIHGTLVSHTLTLNADGTVDGTVVVKTTKKDRKTKQQVSKETTYTLDDAKLSVKTDDRNGDQKRDLADVQAGDRIKLEGRIVHRRGQAKSDPKTTTLRRVKFDDPKPAKPAPAPTPTPTPAA